MSRFISVYGLWTVGGRYTAVLYIGNSPCFVVTDATVRGVPVCCPSVSTLSTPPYSPWWTDVPRFSGHFYGSCDPYLWIHVRNTEHRCWYICYINIQQALCVRHFMSQTDIYVLKYIYSPLSVR